MSDNGKQGKPDPEVPLKDGDTFWLTDLYPDAKALFEHEQVSLDAASQDCIVVLDANVLLLPFEFTSASVGEVERVYKELCGSERLVVPAQAAREFYKNRGDKITKIADAIDAAIGKAKKQIFDKSIPLLEADPDYIEARELGKDLVNKGKEVAAKLEVVGKRLKDESGADRVSVLYRNLLGKCVVEFAVAPGEREAIINEVARRARIEIAPGYKDKAKRDGGIGDYLIWKAILQEAEKRNCHCIFVTEEEKPDWWIKRHGPFQPRPELIEEYRRASGGKSLHLVPLSGLLAVFKATAEVVKQVQDVEERRRNKLLVEVKRRRIIGKPEQGFVDEKSALDAYRIRLAELEERLLSMDMVEHNLREGWAASPATEQHDRDFKDRMARLQAERAALKEHISEMHSELKRRKYMWKAVSQPMRNALADYIIDIDDTPEIDSGGADD